MLSNNGTACILEVRQLEVPAVRLRHTPLGIRDDDLQRALRRQRQEHARQLAATHARLRALQAERALLTRTVADLTQSIERLKLEEQQLHAEPPPDDPVAGLRMTREQYRAFHRAISEGVIRLIQPFLAPDRHTLGDRKGEQYGTPHRP